VIAVAEHLADMIANRAAELSVPLELIRIGKDGRPLDNDGKFQGLLSTGLGGPQLRALLSEHGSVRWLAAQSAGVDNVLVPEVLERDIVVTRTRHVHDVFVAEFSMALILAACKGLPDVVLANQRQEWLTFQPPVLVGQTLAIIGYGEIGQALAKRARPFEMRVIGVRARPEPDAFADEVWGPDRLNEALGQADYVVLAVPGGGDRRHLIGERQLRMLPKAAYLVNVGRGETVDEEALDRVLREEGFAGALIDTFATEPLPRDSPLWTNPRVLVTAHLAGLRAAPFLGDVLDQFIENVRRFGQEEPLMNQVDTARGY